MTQLTLFEDAKANQIIADLDLQLDELELTSEQRQAVYFQILWRLLASSLHPNTVSGTLVHLLKRNLS